MKGHPGRVNFGRSGCDDQTDSLKAVGTIGLHKQLDACDRIEIERVGLGIHT
jgi:hypothetical protein